MNMKVEYEVPLSQNVRHLGRLDIPGGGQVVVQGNYAYVGHMKPPLGTSIIDISDPANPKVVSHVDPPEWSHTHKVRVAGDIMITNVEQDRRPVRGEVALVGDLLDGQAVAVPEQLASTQTQPYTATDTKTPAGFSPAGSCQPTIKTSVFCT